MNPDLEGGHALWDDGSSIRSLESVSTLAGFDDGIDEVFNHIDRTGDGEVSRIELLKELTTTEIGERIGEFFGLDGPVVGPFAKQTFDLVFHYIDFDDSGTIDAGELRSFVAAMDHLTDLWTEHHEAATLKQEEEEMKEGSVALPVWKDPKLAPVLDEMVGVGDPALLSHVTVILSFRAFPELRAAVDAREAAGVKSLTAANRRLKNISPEARVEAAKAKAARRAAALEASEKKQQSSANEPSEEEKLDNFLQNSTLSAEEMEQQRKHAYWSEKAAVLMKKADKMSLSNTATREGLAKHVATSQNANGLLFLAWLNAPRPAEEKSDPSSPSTGKAPPRPLVKGEGPREGLDRFSSYDYQGKGKLTKKELRRAVNDWANGSMVSGAADKTKGKRLASSLSTSWNALADALLEGADEPMKNSMLSRAEIINFGTTQADDTEKKFVDWLCKRRGASRDASRANSPNSSPQNSPLMNRSPQPESPQSGRSSLGADRFSNYESEEGEIPIEGLQQALMDWSYEEQARVEARVAAMEEAKARKRALAEEGKDMLAHADERAVEIMNRCAGDNFEITMSKLKLELEGVPELRAFSQWMCRDKGAKFKLYDVNKGGSIDLEELELALEEYFNSVATEFDEFKGHHLGLFKTRRAVAKAASANSPPSPVLKPMHNTTGSSTTTFKVLLEWVPAWRDMPLVLQSKRFPPVGEAEAKQAKEDQGDEDGALMLTDWVTIYDGAAPKAEVTLSAPTALYMFRTLAAGADPQSFGPPSSSGHHPQAHRGSNIVSSGMEHSSSIGESAAWRGTRISSLDSVGSLGDSSIGSLDDLTFDASQEVYYMAQPSPPSLVGLGRNVLASWEHPILPPADASLYFPPRPFWRIHAKQIASTDSSPSTPSMSVSPSRANKVNKSKQASSPSHKGYSSSPALTAADATTIITTVVGQGPSWALVGGLAENASYEITLTCELPVGLSCHSLPVSHSTVVPSPAVVEDEVKKGAEDNNLQAIKAQEDSGASSKDEVHLALASAVDPTQALASAGVTCAYRFEASHQSAASASTQGRSKGNDTTSRWVSFHRGAATRVAIRDIPIDQVCWVRSRAAIDLRSCARYGNGEVRLVLPEDPPNPLPSLGLAPSPAFGSEFDDAPCHTGPALKSLSNLRRIAISMERARRHGTTDGKNWPGTTNSRSKAYTNLILGYVDGGEAYMFNNKDGQRPSSPSSPWNMNPIEPTMKSIEVTSPSGIYWDASSGVAVCLPPSPPTYMGNAFDGRSNAPASHSSKQIGKLPFSIGSNNGGSLVVSWLRCQSQGVPCAYACEVFDCEARSWYRVYSGPNNRVDLCSLWEASQQQPQQESIVKPTLLTGGEASMPLSIRPLPGTCLLVRTARRFLSTSELATSSSASFPGDILPGSPPLKWIPSPPVVVFLSPQAPQAKWTNNTSHSAVTLSWGAALDTSRLPSSTPTSVHVSSLVLECASAAVLQDDSGSTNKSGSSALATMTSAYEEVVRAPGAHSCHSGPLLPSTRYAYRLTAQCGNRGLASSAPFFVETAPTAPSAPSLSARSVGFKSATSRVAQVLQLTWNLPPNNGLKVDRFLVHSRKLLPKKSEAATATKHKKKGNTGKRELKSPLASSLLTPLHSSSAEVKEMPVSTEAESFEEGNEGRKINEENNTGSNSGGNEDCAVWSEWFTVYLGPNRVALDEETLGFTGELHKQFRVRAGSKLGWGPWSSTLLVQGQIDNHDDSNKGGSNNMVVVIEEGAVASTIQAAMSSGWSTTPVQVPCPNDATRNMVFRCSLNPSNSDAPSSTTSVSVMLEAADSAAVSNTAADPDYVSNPNWQVPVSHEDLVDSLNTIGRTPADLYEYLLPDGDSATDNSTKTAAISNMLSTVAEVLRPRVYFNESKLDIKPPQKEENTSTTSTSSNTATALNAKSDAFVNPKNVQIDHGSTQLAPVDQKAPGPTTAVSSPPSSTSSRGATVVFWPRDPLMGNPSTVPNTGHASPLTRGNLPQSRQLMANHNGDGFAPTVAMSPNSHNDIDIGLDPDLVERVMAAVSAQLPFPLAPALLKGAVVAALTRLANGPQEQEEGNGNNNGNTAVDSNSLEGLVEAAAVAEIESARSRSIGGSGDDVGGFPPVERLVPSASPYLHVDSIRSWPQQPPSRQNHPTSALPPAPTAAPPSSGDSSSSLQGFAWGPRIKPPAKSKSKLRPPPPARSPKMNHAEVHRLQRQQLLLEPLALHAGNTPGGDDALNQNALPSKDGPKNVTADAKKAPDVLALENGQAPFEEEIQSSPQAW